MDAAWTWYFKVLINDGFSTVTASNLVTLATGIIGAAICLAILHAFRRWL